MDKVAHRIVLRRGGYAHERAEVDRAVRRGRPRHARAARRQGRERRGDDARARPRARARAASPSPPRRAWPTCAPTGRSPTAWPTRSPPRCAALEEQAGKRLGDAEDPLLVSVRSGARESMPGMMDTVLNLGLNDALGRGPRRAHGQPALRVGRLPPLRADVRQRLPRHPGRAARGRRSPRARQTAGVQRRRRARRGRPARARRRLQGASTPTRPARSSRRTRRSSCARRSARCSTPGSASAR